MSEQTQVSGMIDPAIFKQVQDEIDEDVKVREEIRGLLKTLDKEERSIQSVLSRVHAVPASSLGSLLLNSQPSFEKQRNILGDLSEVASKYPYYKYNGLWTREIQTASYGVVLAGWLGAFTPDGEARNEGRLMTIDEVGQKLGVAVNVKDADTFHLTLEEYLHSLITMIEELARLAVNSVTLGDYQRPMLISKFVKDLHSGFQLLNLKNDSLRRRSDSIKYNVKKIEDVVYDLALRKLVSPIGQDVSKPKTDKGNN
ncbi:Translin-1 [Dactylella cylindrospora]|nr:Translin-1 [Dactylella cylindrospora]